MPKNNMKHRKGAKDNDILPAALAWLGIRIYCVDGGMADVRSDFVLSAILT